MVSSDLTRGNAFRSSSVRTITRFDKLYYAVPGGRFRLFARCTTDAIYEGEIPSGNRSDVSCTRHNQVSSSSSPYFSSYLCPVLNLHSISRIIHAHTGVVVLISRLNHVQPPQRFLLLSTLRSYRFRIFSPHNVTIELYSSALLLRFFLCIIRCFLSSLVIPFVHLKHSPHDSV